MPISDRPWSDFSQADYTPEQWRRACVVDRGPDAGDENTKQRYSVPIREPNGNLNRNGVHAAAGGHGLGQVTGISAEMRRSAARKIVAAYREMDEEAPESMMTMAGMSMSRSEPEPYARSWALDGIEILRAADGYSDGRTVEAYAAVFDTPTEITDRHGHYMEVIDRTAFNRQIGLGIDRVAVYYHHGMTLHGTPSDLGSVPIGSPVDIRADGRGLRTVTRYNRTPLGDSVLEAIRAGDIRGYSFRGAIYQSNPTRPPKARPGQPLPTVRRTQLGLTEYGPTPTPAYTDAAIVAVRALQMLASSTPGLPAWDQDTTIATPFPGPGAEDQPHGHSGRQRLLRLKAGLRERGV